MEHDITGAILRRLWQKGVFDAEILRAEFDAGGYDLVLTRGSITRHIQLKSSRTNGKTYKQAINLRLCTRPAGCVIWLAITDDLIIDGYLWLGGGPSDPLVLPESAKITRHNKGDSTGAKLPRAGLRDVKKSQFTPLRDLDELLGRLIGPR